MKRLEFTTMRGVNVPAQPWPQVFYVSRQLLTFDAIEVRPLTVSGLVKGVGRNFITMNYWRLLRALYLLGFLPTEELAKFSWRTFTPYFWRHGLWYRLYPVRAFNYLRRRVR